jgi:hypothetical protein
MVDVGRGRDAVPLNVLVDGWLRDGLISSEQAVQLVAPTSALPALSAAAPAREGVPVVAEALAYVGGAVVVAGTSLLTAYYWSDLTAGWRFLLLAVVTACSSGRAPPCRGGWAPRVSGSAACCGWPRRLRAPVPRPCSW